jgi:hypothetical protein
MPLGATVLGDQTFPCRGKCGIFGAMRRRVASGKIRVICEPQLSEKHSLVEFSQLMRAFILRSHYNIRAAFRMER